MSTLRANAITTVAGKPIVNSTGSILQVVSQVWDGSSTTTSSTYVASGLTASIVPSSTSSRILVIAQFWCNVGDTTNHNWLTIFRNNTINLASGANGDSLGDLYAAAGHESIQTLTFLDSPATTSSTIYTVYFRKQTSNISLHGVGGSRRSSMTLIEVSA